MTDCLEELSRKLRRRIQHLALEKQPDLFLVLRDRDQFPTVPAHCVEDLADMMADGPLARKIGRIGFHIDHIVFESFHIPNLLEIPGGATAQGSVFFGKARATRRHKKTGSIVANAPGTDLR